MNPQFSSSYTYEVNVDLPADGKPSVINLPNFDHKGVGSGQLIRVNPSGGESWLGLFRSGEYGYDAVIQCPNERQICVVAGGAGVIANAHNPRNCLEIPVLPVLEVVPLLAHDIMLFTSFTDVCAYGKDGIVWRSNDICCDELKFVSADQSIAEFTAYCCLKSGIVKVYINLQTGKTEVIGHNESRCSDPSGYCFQGAKYNDGRLISKASGRQR